MREFSLLIKPSGPDCNLDCKYCFYKCKSELFGQGRHRMSDEVAERIIKEYLGLGFNNSSFAWQGGEPMLMGLDFYQKVVDMQAKFGSDGQMVTNALQTNAVLMDEQWCEFLKNYNWLVGISLDGPAEYHDHYRLDHAGNGTHSRVLNAINLCKKHRVEFNVLVLVNDVNIKHPDEIFDYFAGLNIRFLQFIPCVENEPGTKKVANFSVTPLEYADFMCRIYDRWREYGIDKISIRLFDSMLSYMLHGEHSNCTFARRCNQYFVFEHNGDAYCCDFFVEPQFKLGNILETPIEKLYKSDVKKNFAKCKANLSQQCLICRYKDVCRGGCLKDRIASDGNFDKASYLCPAYKKIFDHMMPGFREIATKLASGRGI